VIDQSLKQTTAARHELAVTKARLEQLEGQADDDSYFKREQLLGQVCPLIPICTCTPMPYLLHVFLSSFINRIWKD
jgi:hypothetical protein